MKTARHCAVLLFVVAACTALTFADTPGRHPGYLHALSNLRGARAHLGQMGPNEHMDREAHHAIGEIDAAINEFKSAAVEDAKNLNDHPPVNPHMERKERYHRALELLDRARGDAAQEEDDPSARGLRDRALHHVDEARRIVAHLIQQNGY